MVAFIGMLLYVHGKFEEKICVKMVPIGNNTIILVNIDNWSFK